MKIAYAYQHPDPEILSQSSSGGFFTRIAVAVLERGGVVFGARWDEDWKVVVDYSESIEGLAAFRGSKYVQARVGKAYRDCEAFLKEGRLVLFSGTPCMIAGLKSFLKQDYPNLIALDFVCHGTPTVKSWESYLKSLGKKPERVVFRDKCSGWKNYSCDIVNRMSYTRNRFMDVFLNDLTLRDCCYDCRYKAWKSGSDVTIGDFWGIDRICPEIDDDRGMSLVVPHNDRIMELVPELRDCREFQEAVVVKCNPSAIRPAARHQYSKLCNSLLERGFGFSFAYRLCMGSNPVVRAIRWMWKKTR